VAVDDKTLDLWVKQACNTYGVTVTTVFWYRNYALQVRKATKRYYGGDELIATTGALVERYTKMGLRREVLAAIAHDLFNIEVAD
jgi:hypothetical protein